MTRPALAALIAGTLAVGTVAALAYARLAIPDPVAEAATECTTCDARQASKTRLRDHLQSLPD